jgi:uncharacterized membrane protein YozB (DUF420 family)
MRKRNWRFVMVGVFFIVLAFALFFLVTPLGAYSTDPVVFTNIIGQVAQVIIAVSFALIVVGLIGKKS